MCSPHPVTINSRPHRRVQLSSRVAHLLDHLAPIFLRLNGVKIYGGLGVPAAAAAAATATADTCCVGLSFVGFPVARDCQFRKLTMKSAVTFLIPIND